MIRKHEGKVLLRDRETVIPFDGKERPGPGSAAVGWGELRKNTIAWSVLQKHSISGAEDRLRIRFDALASHDITYVGIIQTARAGGLREFPVPYVLTNCHNSLCAVGGTINEDDHLFGLSAAKKYGGIFVPAHLAVIHQYMRETVAGCGKMVLGSDSHTRYGALGTMGFGEGGPELVKQLLGGTYDLEYPDVCLVYLHGKVNGGVGPHDVALAVIGEVFSGGFLKNKILEFAGPGVSGLSMDYRNGIDVMTTETACLSSIWGTDEKVREYLSVHGRGEEYAPMAPIYPACYDCLIDVDLSKIEPMIALPFHPSNAYRVRELIENAGDIFSQVEKEAAKISGGRSKYSILNKIDGRKIRVDQGIIAGCAGGSFENISEAAAILGENSPGKGPFSLSVYPQSQPVFYELNRHGTTNRLMSAGALFKTAFCGPCFGAGDVPGNNTLSIRHTTRNFPNREGSKPGEGQMAGVALMDARSIAATAAAGGILTAATELEYRQNQYEYVFNRNIYKNRVYYGYKNPVDQQLKFGPNIRDWPEIDPLGENLLLMAASVIHDPVTTTDELIPSGETSSFRSNPRKLAEFTLSRKDPLYVGRAKQAARIEEQRKEGLLREYAGIDLENTAVGSFIYASRPGDGSAREQAASCQKVLGGNANIALDYATRRYRSNLVNWGVLPFVTDSVPDIEPGDFLYIPGVREMIREKRDAIKAYILKNGEKKELTLKLPGMTDEEREIILAGCLINYYRAGDPPADPSSTGAQDPPSSHPEPAEKKKFEIRSPSTYKFAQDFVLSKQFS